MVVEKPSQEVEIMQVVDQIIDVDQPMKMQEDEDVQETLPPTISELTYTSFYKLKSMKLLQFSNGQWKHVQDIKDLYMAKIAFSPDGTRVYVIGGAKDSKSKVTSNTVSAFNVTDSGVAQQNLAPMLESRASFGCLYVPRASPLIIVAGGYINGKLSTKCEAFNVNTNTWQMLPELNEAKASSSLCLMNDRFLYCFGGLSRNAQGQAFLSNSVEVIDITNPSARWEKLNINLPITGCDIGCVPIRSD